MIPSHIQQVHPLGHERNGISQATGHLTHIPRGPKYTALVNLKDSMHFFFEPAGTLLAVQDEVYNACPVPLGGRWWVNVN